MTDWTPDRIKALKERLGISYNQMGRLLHCSGRTVRSWVYESEKRQPGSRSRELLEALQKHAEQNEAGTAT